MTDQKHVDLDPTETQEWLDSLESVLEAEGVERAHYLLESMIEKARRNGAHLPYDATTAYLNTIPAGQEPTMPGDQTLETKIRHAIRWNAMMMVLRGSKKDLELGGHISSFASSAMLYDVGFNHFSVHQMKKMVVIIYLFKVTFLQVFILVHLLKGVYLLDN